MEIPVRPKFLITRRNIPKNYHSSNCTNTVLIFRRFCGIDKPKSYKMKVLYIKYKC